MHRYSTKLLLLFFLCSVASWSSAVTPKFGAGDCITPIDKTFTWYGKFARVDAVSKIEGFSEERLYILAFPNAVSNSVLFSLEIEESVARVPVDLCAPK